MDEEFKKKFLFNTDQTGRFVVKSIKTGKVYFVEAIDSDQKTSWGDYNPSTKKFETTNYGDKYKGSIKEEESLITSENGFEKIYVLKTGESPLDYINRLDEEYYKNSLN